ncbi:Serine phosphatase RsbU, regulator of sigma subunit [hydrothermal vent metagenome]|uniref:Serine phosphatase RsbU, regulator of sigma subunit n=1 Tax=hydrothermal vent metagenome TaxID=652676 RepID=A0A3B0TEP9_9ZZZZ
MTNKPTAYRLTIYISGAIIIVLVAFIFVAYNYSHNLLRKNIEKNAVSISAEVLLNVTGHLVTAQEVASNITMQIPFYAEHHNIKQLLSGVADKYPFLQAVFVRLDEGHGDLWASAVNTGGGVIYKEAAGNLNPYFENKELQGLFREKDKKGWTKPYRSKPGNKPVAAYCAPIQIKYPDGEWRNIGFVAVEMSLSYLNKVVNSIKIGERGFAFLVANNGTLITYPDSDKVLKNNLLWLSDKEYSVSIDSVRAILVNGHSGSAVAYPEYYNYEKSWIHYTPILDNNWMLVLVIPFSDLYHDIRIMLFRMVLISVAGLIMIFLLVTYITNRILTPLTRLTAEIQNFSIGKGSRLVLNEVDSLTKSLNRLRVRYEDYKVKEQRAMISDKRFKIDLEQASEIQHSIIPTRFPVFPDRKEIDIYSSYKPAFVISGDLYDYFFIDGRHLLITIGDVSGKGIPAALFMGVAHTLLRRHYSTKVAKRIVKELNIELCDKNQNQFFLTLFLGILDLKTGVLNYCNAAHTATKILRADGSITELDNAHGLPLGLYPERPYEDSTANIFTNDVLVLYTDGLTELEGPGGNYFGEERFKGILRSLKGESPIEIIDQLEKSMELFRGNAKQKDDYSIVALKFTPLISL